jgi:UPF0271 protein
VTSIDLNADVGEGVNGLGAGGDGDGGREGDGDRALLLVVTSAHVACGFHAGGPALMRRTLAAAAASGVAVGAHPSYPDREGFGRRSMDLPLRQVVDDVVYQIGALDGLARMEGVRVRSVKPHGALYSRMAGDEECTGAVAEALLAYGGGLRLVLPAGSRALTVAAAAGVTAVPEAFCDRGYLADGSLAPRGTPGALVAEPAEAARRAVLLATRGTVTALDGTELSLAAQTLCVHGDTPGAVAVATAVRDALARAGVALTAP